MKLNIVLIFTFFIGSVQVFAQELTSEEKKLYTLIMEYRAEKGLPEIPLSASLTHVAKVHVNDLIVNKPDTNECNAHSWSSNGEWSPCCYTPDHAEGACVWSKPRELTTYQGNGYEIACGSNGCCSDFIVTATYALNSWKKSPGHNSLIVNESIWENKQWGAIGIALDKGFAVVWFGEEPDN